MQLNKLLSQNFNDPDLMDWVADVEEYLLENHSEQLTSEKKAEIKESIRQLRLYGADDMLTKNHFDQIKAILKRMQPEDPDDSNNQDTESNNEFQELKTYLIKLSTLESGIEPTDLKDLEQQSHALQSRYSQIDFITLFEAMSNLRL